jgi:hypothetical protein
MTRWLRITGRGVLALVAVLCVAAATPAVAQQASTPAVQAGTSSRATTPVAGPRLRAEWQRADLGFADNSASGAAATAASTTTITVTTLVLVLAVVILVLLIA